MTPIWKGGYLQVIENMVDLVGIEPTTLFHAMEAEKPPPIDSKGLKNRLRRQNRPNRRYLLPICYQNLPSGSGGLIVGDRPFLIFWERSRPQRFSRNRPFESVVSNVLKVWLQWTNLINAGRHCAYSAKGGTESCHFDRPLSSVRDTQERDKVSIARNDKLQTTNNR
jgi:hypothetical protein